MTALSRACASSRSYQPTVTKRYIRAEYKDSKGAWHYVPLDMTAVDQLTPETENTNPDGITMEKPRGMSYRKRVADINRIYDRHARSGLSKPRDMAQVHISGIWNKRAHFLQHNERHGRA